MLGEIIDTYKKGNIKIVLNDGYVFPNFTIYYLNYIIDEGCLHEYLTAKELYKKLISGLRY